MSNVRDFGAEGNGRADDTAAVRHAVAQGDGRVEFPRGVYRLSGTVEVDLAAVGRTSLSGLGGVATLQMDAPGPAFTIKGTHAGTADPASFRPEEWARERFPTVQDLEIVGGHVEADGILVDGVMQPTFTGVLVREVRHALRLVNRARNLVVNGCHFYHNTGVGVFLDRVNLHQAIVTGSHISYCLLGGVRIEGSEVRNLQITGNDIEYNNIRAHPDAPAEPTAEIYIDVGEKGTVREGTIASNTIQATASDSGANIRVIGGGAEGQRAGMWTIAGNLIGSQKTNVHLTGVRGVTISGNYLYSGHHRNLLAEHCRNLVVGANCFGHNPDYRKNELATGIRFEDCANATLSGLLIEDAEAGRHTVPGAEPISRQALIELVRCRRFNLTGVQVLDPTPAGIYLSDCSETLITGCTVHDDREPRLMRVAVAWVGEGANNLIANCRLGRGSAGTIVAPGHVEVRDNLLDGE